MGAESEIKGVGVGSKLQYKVKEVVWRGWGQVLLFGSYLKSLSFNMKSSLFLFLEFNLYFKPLRKNTFKQGFL